MKRAATAQVSDQSTDKATTTDGREAEDRPPPAGCLPCFAPTSFTTSKTARVAAPVRSLWDDWRWQMKHRIRSLADLASCFPGLAVSDQTAQAAATFPLAITPYYAALIRRPDRTDPVFRMCVPDAEELRDPPFLIDDPLAEDEHMPVPGLVHRYRDRALLLATSACSTYCRHCTRKRVAGQSEECMSAVRLAQTTEYLSVHPEIHDVIISGGDPFTMRTEVLERIVKAVRAVPSVEIIRIGTRTPVVLPMRITAELVDMLKRYHPIYVNTHFNHPVELTPEARTACTRLADAGIPLGNQSVLLRGVNDDALLLADLFRALVRVRVRPYYLFQCDLVRGVEHFRTPLSKGIEIMEYLRGRLSGLAIPSFVVDAPSGGGKIPLLPNYQVSTSPTHTVLRNFAGNLVSYPEPQPLWGTIGAHAEPSPAPGVWELACGRTSRIREHPAPVRSRPRGPRRP